MRLMRLLSFALAALLPSMMLAQSSGVPSPSTVKDSRYAAYKWIDDYSIAISSYRKTWKKDFLALFDSRNTMVPNDFWASNGFSFECQTVSVADYLAVRDSTRKGFYTQHCKIRNAKIVGERFVDGSIITDVVFVKEVSYKDTTRSSVHYEYPSIPLEMNVSVAYRDGQSKCISLSSTPLSPFVVFHDGTQNVRMSHSQFAKEVDDRNSLIPIVTAHSVSPLSFDSKMKSVVSDTLKNEVSFGLFFGKTLTTAANIDNDYLKSVDAVGNYCFSASLGYYHQLRLRNMNRWGVQTGLTLRKSSVKYEATAHEEYNDIDPDGGPYLRIVDIPNYTETLSRTSLGVPVLCRFEHFFKKKYAFVAKSGLVFNFDVQQNMKADASLRVSGYYDWLFDVLIDQQGIYDFGQSSLSNTSNSTAFPKFSADFVVETGLSVYLTRRFALTGQLEYDHCLWGKVNPDGNFLLIHNSAQSQSCSFGLSRHKLNSIGFNLSLNYCF